MIKPTYDPLEYWESLKPHHKLVDYTLIDGHLKKGLEVTPDYLAGDEFISAINPFFFMENPDQRLHSVYHYDCNLIAVGTNGNSPLLFNHALPLNPNRSYPFGMSSQRHLSDLSGECFQTICYALTLLSRGEMPWIISYYRESHTPELKNYLEIINRDKCLDALTDANIDPSLLTKIPQINIPIPDHSEHYNVTITQDGRHLNLMIKQFDKEGVVWQKTNLHDLSSGKLVEEM